MTARVTKKKYLIGTDFTNDGEVVVIECEPSELTARVDSWIADTYTEREDLEIYELGRKGIMPKVEIQFI